MSLEVLVNVCDYLIFVCFVCAIHAYNLIRKSNTNNDGQVQQLCEGVIKMDLEQLETREQEEWGKQDAFSHSNQAVYNTNACNKSSLASNYKCTHFHKSAQVCSSLLIFCPSCLMITQKKEKKENSWWKLIQHGVKNSHIKACQHHSERTYTQASEGIFYGLINATTMITSLSPVTRPRLGRIGQSHQRNFLLRLSGGGTPRHCVTNTHAVHWKDKL